MKISEESLANINRLVNDGYVRESKLNSLSIFTYTPKAEFSEIWNDKPEARSCRGLVLDSQTKEIVIPCVKKFFNHDSEFAPRLSLEESEITLKEDGYLIQVVKTDDYGLVITSKGSFSNKYVDAAKEFIDTFYIEEHLKTDIVYICELLKDFPEDEGIIVTKHGKITRLVCWAMVDRNTGEELHIADCPFETVEIFSSEEAKKYLTQEVEGIVLHDWKTGERVKMKTQWFFEAHRIISGCTKRKVYEILREGKKVEDLDIPDEYMKKMIQWQDELLYEKNRYSYNTFHYLETFKNFSDKEIAEMAGSAIPKNYVSLMFALKKGKLNSFNEMIWKFIGQKL